MARDRASGVEEVTPSSTPILTLADAKLQCRVDDDREDLWFGDAITAVARYLETHWSFSPLTRTLAATFRRWPPDDSFHLPLGPVQSVTSITYTDSANTAVVWHQAGSEKMYLGTSDTLRMIPGIAAPSAGLRDHDAIRIVYTAGYSSPPAPVLHAARMILAHWWVNREAAALSPGVTLVEVPFAVASILDKERRLP